MVLGASSRLWYNNTMKILAAGLIVCVSILLFPSASYGATASDLQKQLQNTRKKQEQLKKEQEKKEADAAALNSLLKRIDENINRTTNALKSTGERLEQTNKDLDQTKEALSASEAELAELKLRLEELLKEFYELEVAASPLLEMFAAQNMSQHIATKEYYDTLNAEFDALVHDEEETRKRVAESKSKLENQQAELSHLKSEQQATKNGLESEQERKQRVLADTNTAIDKLEKEQAALASREKEVEKLIQAALAKARVGGKFVGGLNEAVKKGDVVGFQGNTGFSTGSHLHFTVMQDCDFAKTVNPLNYIGKSLASPLDSYRLTQGFGMTDFAKSGAYHGAPHNGIDMQEYPGAPIKAAADGVVRLRQYFGGYGNAVIIEHASIGLCSLYGHLG